MTLTSATLDEGGRRKEAIETPAAPPAARAAPDDDGRRHVMARGGLHLEAAIEAAEQSAGEVREAVRETRETARTARCGRAAQHAPGPRRVARGRDASVEAASETVAAAVRAEERAPAATEAAAAATRAAQRAHEARAGAADPARGRRRTEIEAHLGAPVAEAFTLRLSGPISGSDRMRSLALDPACSRTNGF